MLFSPSPSPVPPPPPPLTFSPPSPDEIYELQSSVLRYAPIFLIVLAVFLICVEGGRLYREHYHMPSAQPRPQPRPGRLLRLQRSRPSPPRSDVVCSIISTYRIKNTTAGNGCYGACSICLEDFQDGDECRKFVTCNHVFHRACIDLWLARDRHCPLCRGSIRGVRSVNADEQV